MHARHLLLGGGALASSLVLAAGIAHAALPGGLRVRLPWRAPASPDAVVLAGVVEAREVDLRAPAGGRVLEVRCREGQRVAAGELLVALDEPLAAAELAGAEAARARAAARLALLEGGAHPDDLAAARARLALQAAREADAARELARLERLQGSGVATAEARERAAGERDRARAARAVVTAELARLEAGARPEELADARAAVAEAAARVAAARARLDDARVQAPVAATCVRRYVEPGEIASPGALLLTLADLDRLEVRVFLLEPHLGRAGLGAPVEIAADAWPGRTFRGRIARIADEAEFTPRTLQTPEDRVRLVFAATVAVEDARGALLPGMPVDVRLTLAPASGRGGEQ